MADPTLSLVGLRASGPQILITWSVDELVFHTTYWYDFDLADVRDRIGEEPFERLLFHIAMFEINKGVSLRPGSVDLRQWAPLLTPELAALWRTILVNVWGQWRWEHDDPDYRGPCLPPVTPARAQPLAASRPGSALVFCGGGKDSLVALDLLARAGVDHTPFVYSSSIYGRAADQHRLVGDLLERVSSGPIRRQWVYDEFADSPVLEAWVRRLASAGEPPSDPPIRSLTAAETPSSIFASLPVAVAGGHEHIVLGHERSANHGNLVWEKTGEEVNHQWGKSLAAERLLNEYIRTQLFSGVTYFSLLQPVHDPLIFALLRRRPDALPFTHSCNVRKPWCRRCAKCAYVWINYKAWLPWSIVDPMFGGENLLDTPENVVLFEQMLGLRDHIPFECIGQLPETRLAFAMARARGLGGRAMDLFASGVPAEDWLALADRYLAVSGDHGIPPAIAGPVLSDMRRESGEARRFVRALLG